MFASYKYIVRDEPYRLSLRNNQLRFRGLGKLPITDEPVGFEI